VGVGLATSRVVRLVVHVVGVEALREIYKAWSDSFKGKDDLEDIGTDGRITSRMSRLGNSCSALKQHQKLVAKNLYRFVQKLSEKYLLSVPADISTKRNSLKITLSVSRASEQPNCLSESGRERRLKHRILFWRITLRLPTETNENL